MDEQRISQILERLEILEVLLRANNDLLVDLSERIGDTFAKQAYTVKDLMLRWNCSETQVRNIITSHKLSLLRGSDKKYRKPITVLRSSVLEYERGFTSLNDVQKKRTTKPVPSWADSPFLSKPELKLPFGKGVRKLGEIPCEQAQVKSRARKGA